MCPSAPRVCSEPGGKKPLSLDLITLSLSLSLDLIKLNQGLILQRLFNLRRNFLKKRIFWCEISTVKIGWISIKFWVYSWRFPLQAFPVELRYTHAWLMTAAPEESIRISYVGPHSTRTNYVSWHNEIATYTSLGNRPISQISQRIRQTYHNAPFVTEMWTPFCYKLCIMGCGTGALWGCKIGLLDTCNHHGTCFLINTPLLAWHAFHASIDSELW